MLKESRPSSRAARIMSQPEDLPWLKAAELSFEFWDNEEDAVYDNL